MASPKEREAKTQGEKDMNKKEKTIYRVGFEVIEVIEADFKAAGYRLVTENPIAAQAAAEHAYVESTNHNPAIVLSTEDEGEAYEKFDESVDALRKPCLMKVNGISYLLASFASLEVVHGYVDEEGLFFEEWYEEDYATHYPTKEEIEDFERIEE